MSNNQFIIRRFYIWNVPWPAMNIQTFLLTLVNHMINYLLYECDLKWLEELAQKLIILVSELILPTTCLYYNINIIETKVFAWQL